MPGPRRSISSEITSLRHTLKAFDRSLRRLTPLLSDGAALKASSNENDRSLRLSAKVRAAMVLQGRYMGFMRQLKPRQKALARRIREVKGVRAAIVRARRLGG